MNFRVLAPDDADPQPSIAGGFLSLTYFRFTDGSVSYATQRSGDLGAWNPILPTETTLLTYPTIEVRKATDPVPLGSDARRFLRMQIATP